MKIDVPPIKSQGIKTKLVPWIRSVVPHEFDGVWIEPFMGTGVVAFNLAPTHALLCDVNPHVVNFYEAIAAGDVTPEIVRQYLNREGAKLLEKGETHYYELRDKFNRDHDPLKFLFLNRAGFNGMIRFNRKGELNIPFCRKPQRFAQAYITKIVNQVSHVSRLCRTKNFVFKCQDFMKTIIEGRRQDIIYCDPPYIDRHVDYYSSWDEEHERALFAALSDTRSKFILSTWHHNDFRENEYIDLLWSRFNVLTRKHFYHVGGSEQNRNFIMEAIVTNYDTLAYEFREQRRQEQLRLLETRAGYDNA